MGIEPSTSQKFDHSGDQGKIFKFYLLQIMYVAWATQLSLIFKHLNYQSYTHFVAKIVILCIGMINGANRLLKNGKNAFEVKKYLKFQFYDLPSLHLL